MRENKNDRRFPRSLKQLFSLLTPFRVLGFSLHTISHHCHMTKKALKKLGFLFAICILYILFDFTRANRRSKNLLLILSDSKSLCLFFFLFLFLFVATLRTLNFHFKITFAICFIHILCFFFLLGSPFFFIYHLIFAFHTKLININTKKGGKIIKNNHVDIFI